MVRCSFVHQNAFSRNVVEGGVTQTKVLKRRRKLLALIDVIVSAQCLLDI